jgi:hypothetical protein
MDPNRKSIWSCVTGSFYVKPCGVIFPGGNIGSDGLGAVPIYCRICGWEEHDHTNRDAQDYRWDRGLISVTADKISDIAATPSDWLSILKDKFKNSDFWKRFDDLKDPSYRKLIICVVLSIVSFIVFLVTYILVSKKKEEDSTNESFEDYSLYDSPKRSFEEWISVMNDHGLLGAFAGNPRDRYEDYLDGWEEYNATDNKWVHSPEAKTTDTCSTTSITTQRKNKNNKSKISEFEKKCFNWIKESKDEAKREAKVSGASVLPSSDPPHVLRVVNNGVCMGYITRVALSTKTYNILPKHFLDTPGPISIEDLNGVVKDADIRNQCKIHGSLDLALYAGKACNNLKSYSIAIKPANNISCHITVCRDGKWFNHISQRAWSWDSSPNEQEYWSTTLPGDCGLPVVYNNQIVGMHVGSKGEDKGNLFVPLMAPPVAGWLIKTTQL